MLVYLLVIKLDTFGGVGAFGSKIPQLTAAIVALGFAWGLVLRVAAPTVHARIGRFVSSDH